MGHRTVLYVAGSKLVSVCYCFGTIGAYLIAEALDADYGISNTSCRLLGYLKSS